MSAENRFAAKDLVEFATGVLSAGGMEDEKARAVAQTLVDGDLLGHDTHGLALLEPYMDQIENRLMTLAGSPEVIKEAGASMLWDGKRLPGPWLMNLGYEALKHKARAQGTATLVIRDAHHIACLASHLHRASDDGFLMLIASSDPTVQSVAPHGGTQAVFTPNPIAASIPTSEAPFLVDISSSITTLSMARRLKENNQTFSENCLLDNTGRASNDPKDLWTTPAGSMLPLGGMHYGHKGFGLALTIEALTTGLAGRGRADPNLLTGGWAATVFISLFDLDAFGGNEAFRRQTDWLAQTCRANVPRPGVDQVRMPGDRSQALRERQMIEGVALHPTIIPALQRCSARYGVELPRSQET